MREAELGRRRWALVDGAMGGATVSCEREWMRRGRRRRGRGSGRGAVATRGGGGAREVELGRRTRALVDGAMGDAVASRERARRLCRDAAPRGGRQKFE